MFLLSIIPIPVNPGDKPTDPNNKLKNLEYEIKNLEGLLTSAHLGTDFDLNPYTSGIDKLDDIYYKKDGSVNIELVQKVLEKARQADIKLRTTADDIKDDTPMYRFAEISNKVAVAEQRIRDLRNLAESLMNGSYNIPVVSGLNTAFEPRGAQDLNVVNNELKKVLAYKNDLESARGFWGEIESAHKNAVGKSITEVTKSEMFWGFNENGFVGIKRLEQLNDLLYSLIRGDANPPVVSGLRTPQNPSGDRDANVLRVESEKVRVYLETRIQAAKKQDWYPELERETENRLAKIQNEKKDAEKQANTLEKQLYEILKNPYNSIVDANMIRQNLYRQRALVSALNSESQFLTGIFNPKDSESPAKTIAKADTTQKPAKPKSPPGFTYSVSHLPPKIDHSYDFTGLHGRHQKKKRNH